MNYATANDVIEAMAKRGFEYRGCMFYGGASTMHFKKGDNIRVSVYNRETQLWSMPEE